MILPAHSVVSYKRDLDICEIFIHCSLSRAKVVVSRDSLGLDFSFVIPSRLK